MNFCSCGKSWNHRIVRVGRELWRSSCLSPLPRQGHFEQVTEEHIQADFECLQRQRLDELPGQLFQCSATPNVQKFFLMLS